MHSSAPYPKGFILLCSLAFTSVTAIAAHAPHTGSDYTSYPAGVVPDVVPKLMINLSKDHQLWEEAYSDFDDVDGDGRIDTSYNNQIEYQGYFNPTMCYDYDYTDRRFEEDTLADQHRCTSAFSGNFLNWASMTKIDMLRKLFYGGKRFVDTDSLTVIERASLPTDGHAFVKHYVPTDPDPLVHPPLGRLIPWSTKGGETIENISICNVTVPKPGNNSTLTQNDWPPVMRFAFAPRYDIDQDGVDERDVDFSLWDSNERWQCMWREELNNPPNASGTPDTLPRQSHAFEENFMPANGGDYMARFPTTSFKSPSYYWDGLPHQSSSQTNVDFVVRVVACAVSQDGCKRYPDGNSKPAGLLQDYGEYEDVHFGLMTGSYRMNASGGVLRKNIGSMENEINYRTDGTFRNITSDGFIDTLDRLSIFGYYYGPFNVSGYSGQSGTYLPSPPTGSDCSYNLSEISNGQCHSWGNPVGELFVESLRYFAGESATSAFDVDDSTLDSTLPSNTAWEDPLTSDSYCAPLNILTINANVNSYDSLTDPSRGTADYDGFDDLPGSPNIRTWTNRIGNSSHEDINGNTYLIGATTTDTTSPNGNELCTPKRIDNLADARGICPKGPSLHGTYNVAGAAYYGYTTDLRDDLPDVQRVRSFAINMAGGTPIIDIPKPSRPGESIKLAPAMRNGDGGGTLMTFKILNQQYDGDDLIAGEYFVSWEDSEQGGDYDMDMWGILDFDFNPTQDRLRIRSKVITQATPSRMAFGYVLGNTAEDEFHAYSGTSHLTDFGCWRDRDDANNPFNTVCDQSEDFFEKHVGFNLPSTAGQLHDPLYYAAKYGGFDDTDGDLTLNGPDDWDNVINVTGEDGTDGIPDAYFKTNNPTQFAVALNSTLQKIARRGNYSTTDASLSSASYRNVGIAIKTAFDTRIRGDHGAVEWVGHMFGLFVDPAGYLREDSNGDLTLGNYATDYVVEFRYNSTTGFTEFRRLRSTQPGFFIQDSADAWQGIDQIRAVWNSTTELSNTNTAVAMRPYGGNTADGRHIFTGVDSNEDGFVTQDDTVPLNEASITASNFSYFGVDTEAEADAIAEYIRGEDVAGMRNRTLITGATSRRFILGDIAGSSPLVVGRPADHYDVLYRDTDYAEFARTYGERRHVAYVGANDGMLHAFNLGFFNEMSQSYTTQNTSGSGVEQPFGGELWGYVPQAALPHLQWYTQPEYRHTAYVDGAMTAFDAQIFDDDADHPGGWGTVLVANMGMGGGTITIDTDPGANESLHERSSSISIFDITNPESAPTLLAEISHPRLGLTTGKPAVVHIKDATNDKWFLVFGSGPRGEEATMRDVYAHGSSNQNAALFVWDLTSRSPSLTVLDVPGAANSYVGEITAVDWDLNRKTDALYFGTAGFEDNDTANTLGGSLYALSIAGASPADWELRTLLAVDQPFSRAPTVAIDERQTPWVFAASGRLMVTKDLQRTARRSVYGIRDDGVVRDLDHSQLTNVSNAQVKTDYSVTGISGVDNFGELLSTVESSHGWFRHLTADDAAPSASAYHALPLAGKILFVNSYKPKESLCEDQGDSELQGLFYKTGTAHPANNVFLQPIASDTIDPSISISQFRTSNFAPSFEYVPVRSTRATPRKCPVGQALIRMVGNERSGSTRQIEACIFGPVNSAEVSWREVTQ